MKECLLVNVDSEVYGEQKFVAHGAFNDELYRTVIQKVKPNERFTAYTSYALGTLKIIDTVIDENLHTERLANWVWNLDVPRGKRKKPL